MQRRLRPESDENRKLSAKVTPADVAELRARMSDFNTEGQVLNVAGMVEKTKPEVTRSLMLAKAAPSGISGAFMDWLKGQKA